MINYIKVEIVENIFIDMFLIIPIKKYIILLIRI